MAFFAMTATVAAAALWRTKTRILRLTSGWITGYLMLVLLLCKAFGALTYGAVLVPLVRWASPRLQLGIACVLVSIALAYPTLRVADLVPTTSILEVASAVSADRAASLKTRFDNEDQLLARAWERKWFGWGRLWAQSRLPWLAGARQQHYRWILDYHLGHVRLGRLCRHLRPAFTPRVPRCERAKVRDRREAPCLSAVALIVAVNIFDCLPNASITPWSWLLVGALLGRAEALSVAARLTGGGRSTDPVG